MTDPVSLYVPTTNKFNINGLTSAHSFFDDKINNPFLFLLFTNIHYMYVVFRLN